MFDDDFKMGAVGPDGEIIIVDEPTPVRVPKQTVVTVDLSEEIKQEIAFNVEVGDRKITNLVEIMESTDDTSYLIEEFLPSNGMGYIAGASGSGKTILAMQFGGDLIFGRPTISYQIGEDFKDKNVRVLLISLEMNRQDLKKRSDHMFPNLTDEERKLFMENFQVYCEPEPFKLWQLPHVIELTKIIKQCKPDLVIIDSASIAFAQAMTNEEQVSDSIENLYKIRTRLDVAILMVAHTRKPGQGILSSPEETTLNELMGVAGVGQSASGIIIMVEDENSRKATIKNGTAYKDEKVVWFINAKARFGANAGAFKTKLTAKNDVDKGEPLMFRRNAIPIANTGKPKASVGKPRSNSPLMADTALKDIFAQFAEDDD